jgi:hypothetical protein
MGPDPSRVQVNSKETLDPPLEPIDTGAIWRRAQRAEDLKEISELKDLNVLQGNRIDERTRVLKGLYNAVVCGLPLEDRASRDRLAAELRRVRETVDTDEDKRPPQESLR